MTEINQVILPNEKFVFLQNDANQIKGIMQYRTYEPKEYESSDITNLFQNFSSKEKNSELIYKKLKLNKYTNTSKLLYIGLLETFEQNKGYGSQMLKHIINEENPDMIFLEAWCKDKIKDNPTVSFYKKNGFVLEETTSNKEEPFMIWEK